MPVANSDRDIGTGDSAPIIEAPHKEASGIFENLTAGYRSARAGSASTRAHQNNAESVYYDQIAAALNAKGYTTTDTFDVRPDAIGYTGPKNLPTNAQGIAQAPSSPRGFRNPLGAPSTLGMGNSLAWGQKEGDAMWAAVDRERQRNPSFLKDLPDRAAVTTRAHQDRQKIVREASDITDRAGTIGTVANFVGGVAGSWQEPESYIGGPEVKAGATVARTLLKGALSEAATNAAAGAVVLPTMAQDAESLGAPMTGGDMVKSVAEQAAFGAAFHLGRKGIGAASPVVARVAGRGAEAALSAVPKPVKRAAMAASLRAGTVADRDLLHEVRVAHAPFTIDSTATPDEHAAAHVVERTADVRESSPLHPTSDAPNEGRLNAVMASLGMHADAPTLPSPAPLPASHPARQANYGNAPGTTLTARINHAEGTGKNPQSTAFGTGQFLKSTWLGMIRDHGPADIASLVSTDAKGRPFVVDPVQRERILGMRADPKLGARMTQIFSDQNGRYLRNHGIEDSAGNRSLAHFLGADDARKVLQAAPGTPVESLVRHDAVAANMRVLHGKSASEVIAWAHKRIGEHVGEPVARAEAVSDVPVFDEADAVSSYVPPVEHRTYLPGELTTDASAMQYKSGGDSSGVTDRLQGVEQWNPLLSGKVVVWEALDGRNVIADGHQRLGLAQRIADADPSQNVRLDAVVVREADGVTAQQARVIGALKNIAEGTGSAVDAARVLRDAPDGMRMLPPRAANVRTTQGLVALSNDGFGAVLNNVIDPEMAARVGLIAGDRPEAHMPLIAMLKGSGVATPGQAETVVRQALADGFGKRHEEQLGMFAEMPQESLYGPAAKILDAARKQLRSEKRSFRVLTSDAARIEGAGNKLDRSANEAKVIDSDTAIGILDATAHSSGPVRDALLAAAQTHFDGNRNKAVRQFLDAIDGIDLHAAARGVDDRNGDRALSERHGSAGETGEADTELADGRGVQGGPTTYDEAVAAGHASLDFSDPVGPATKAQTAAVEHDLLATEPDMFGNANQTDKRAALERQGEGRANTDVKQKPPGSDGGLFDNNSAQPVFQLGEEGSARTAKSILDEHDAEIAAIEAVGSCL